MEVSVLGRGIVPGVTLPLYVEVGYGAASLGALSLHRARRHHHGRHASCHTRPGEWLDRQRGLAV